MALWGASWGFSFPWGGTDPGPKFACTLAQTRVLVQHPDAPGERKFRDWICAVAEPAGHYLDVCADVKEAFDLSTAVGDQLDLIGGMLNLPRSGFDDARYLTLLEIKSQLLIGALPEKPDWVGTTNNILAICRKFIGSYPQPIVLLNLLPYSYVLSVPGVTLAELDILVGFVCQATWAGVLGQIYIVLDVDSLWASDHGVVADSGIWCSAHGVVVGCAKWGHTIPIGCCDCIPYP